MTLCWRLVASLRVSWKAAQGPQGVLGAPWKGSQTCPSKRSPSSTTLSPSAPPCWLLLWHQEGIIPLIPFVSFYCLLLYGLSFKLWFLTYEKNPALGVLRSPFSISGNVERSRLWPHSEPYEVQKSKLRNDFSALACISLPYLEAVQAPLTSLGCWASPWWPRGRGGKRKRKKISKKRDTLGDISKSLLCYTRVSLYERIIIYLAGSTLRGLLVIFSLFLTNIASVNILVHMYKNTCKINA